jgi:uncharacterized membrane protein YjjP (DUF1212 family)
MLEPAAALNRAGESVALNQARMERISNAYGVTDARVAVMPNMVLAAGGRGIPAALEFSRAQPFGNRLDQTAAIADLARDVHATITFISIGLGVLVGNAIVLRFTRPGPDRRHRPSPPR